MAIPTEPIGSVPRPSALIDAQQRHARGELDASALEAASDAALRDTIRRFEETGSPVLADGEQTKSSFVTYPLDGATNLAAGGLVIPFEDGHTRQLPHLVTGPFRYATHAVQYLRAAQALTTRPVKQAVISASALSLLYPQVALPGYSRDTFLDDLVHAAEADIRQCLDAGAATVQIDFTEGRLSLKLDPSGGLLRQFVALNNRVLDRFSSDERRRIGVHTCPGGDRDATHSAAVPYDALLPTLFTLNAGRFYVQLASEADPERVLQVIARERRPNQVIFVGVTDPIDPRVETPEQVCARVQTAAKHIPVDALGTTDDCGFSPFADDTSTSRDVAFAKIRARVLGTQMAESGPLG